MSWSLPLLITSLQTSHYRSYSMPWVVNISRSIIPDSSQTKKLKWNAKSPLRTKSVIRWESSMESGKVCWEPPLCVALRHMTSRGRKQVVRQPLELAAGSNETQDDISAWGCYLKSLKGVTFTKLVREVRCISADPLVGGTMNSCRSYSPTMGLEASQEDDFAIVICNRLQLLQGLLR